MESSAFGALPVTTRATPAPTSVQPHGYPYSDPKNTIALANDARLQISAAEGTYDLRDEVTLGDVQPHPSDRGLQINVLDTKPTPPISGVKLSITSLTPQAPVQSHPRTRNAANFRSVFTSNSTDTSHSPSQNGSEPFASSHAENQTPTLLRSRFGDGNSALVSSNTKDTKDPTKKRKPKGVITKGHSSFVARASPHDNFSKRIQENQNGSTYGLANISRAMYWLDLLSTSKQDQLMKIVFARAHALCHDLNEASKTTMHLDYIIGFNTSDIIWLEPVSQRYAHLNKNGAIHSSPISKILWLPGSESLFVAAHHDGCLTFNDKEKDDSTSVIDDDIDGSSKVSSDGRRHPRLLIKKSVQSKNQKTNPLAYWKATNQRINDMAFSPDGALLALACEDGSLRIIDYLKEELVDLYRSYYGGFNCAAWSPDGEYILTGGQDDLVSIWSLDDRALVARCTGHKSWVASVSFDAWRCDGTTYRFGSVAEDGRLLLWDFSVGMLNQPRAASIRQSVSRSGSVVTTIPGMVDSPTAEAPGGEEDSITHAVLPRSAVAMLPPIMTKVVDEKHALSSLTFEEDCIIVSCRLGHVYTWDRPKQASPSALVAQSEGK